jgi:cytochrome c oxidase cbb3-type subunit III
MIWSPVSAQSAVVLLSAAVSVICAVPGAAGAAAPALSPGQRLFQRECAGCHGPAGEGGRGPTLAVPQLVRARDQAALAKVIENGISGTEMPPHRLPAAQIAELARWVRRLGQRPAERIPGDAARGRVLYAGKGGCQICHAIRGEGGVMGPDLTDIGLRRGASHLRRSLVEPEASVPKASSPYRSDVAITQNFLQVRVLLKDGTELTGVRVNEDTFSIQLRDAASRLHSFYKSELRAVRKDWNRSPMPSYKEAFTGPELDDLVAYMASLRETPERIGGEGEKAGH